MAGMLNVFDEKEGKYIPWPVIKGEDGRGIRSFGYDGERDLWIVVYTDGTSESIQGPTLESGAAVSPLVEFTAIDGGYRLSITDAEGTKTADLLHGKTPVKGTDYFTEADKQELVAAVKNSLTAETWTFELENGTTVEKVVLLK